MVVFTGERGFLSVPLYWLCAACQPITPRLQQLQTTDVCDLMTILRVGEPEVTPPVPARGFRTPHLDPSQGSCSEGWLAGRCFPQGSARGLGGQSPPRAAGQGLWLLPNRESPSERGKQPCLLRLTLPLTRVLVFVSHSVHTDGRGAGLHS